MRLSIPRILVGRAGTGVAAACLAAALSISAGSVHAAARAPAVTINVRSLQSFATPGTFSEPVAVKTKSGWTAVWAMGSRLSVSDTKAGLFQPPTTVNATLPDGAVGTAQLDDPIAIAVADDGTVGVAWVLDDLSTVKPDVAASWSQWVAYAYRSPQGRWSTPVALTGKLPYGVQRLKLFAVGGGFVLSIAHLRPSSTYKHYLWTTTTLELDGAKVSSVPQAQGAVWQAGSGLVSLWAVNNSLYLARRTSSGWSAPRRIASEAIDDAAAVGHPDVAVDSAGDLAAVLHESGETVHVVIAQPSGAVTKLSLPGVVSLSSYASLQVIAHAHGFAFIWTSDLHAPRAKQGITIATAATWTPAGGVSVTRLGETNAFNGPKLTETAAGVVAYWTLPTRAFASVLHGASWSQPVTLFRYMFGGSSSDTCCLVVGASSSAPQLLWIEQSQRIPNTGSSIEYAAPAIRSVSLAPGGWSVPTTLTRGHTVKDESYYLLSGTDELDASGSAPTGSDITPPTITGGDAFVIDSAGRIGIRDQGNWTFSAARHSPSQLIGDPVGGVGGDRGVLLWAVVDAKTYSLESIDTAVITRG